MRRRSRASSLKSRRRKRATLKRASGAETARPQPAGSEETEIARLTRQRDDALEREKATSEVLRVISSSPGELEAVFQKILENATRICDAKFAQLFGYADGMFHMLSGQNIPPEMAEFQRQPRVWAPDTAFGRLALDRKTIHVLDTLADSKSANSDVGRQMSIRSGVRTLLAVPMIKDTELVGAFCIYRSKVQSFTDKQIALVTNFAAQAVIAIENTRLLSELRESLQQQTATADVLKVISSSPGDLRPIFETMLESATRICEANFGMLNLAEGDATRVVAMHNVSEAYAQLRRHEPLFRFGPKHPLARVAASKQVLHIPDVLLEISSPDPEPGIVRFVELTGARTVLVVPMLKDDELVGALSIYRQEVRPFTDKQTALVQNFANQAVIAIENTRLLNELRESLEQQTATADVLRVISSSRGELEPVFQTILQNAMQICEAKFGMFFRYDRGAFHTTAALGVPPTYAEYLRGRAHVLSEHPHNPLTRVASTKVVLLVPDAREYQPYIERNPRMVALVELAGARTLVTIPLLKDGELIGAMTVYRQEVRPFTDKQIELLKNFAAQAVIAIENARLLNDLNKLNQQLEQRVADQVGEIERMGRLRRFLPPQVADLIVASGTEKQLESHRREITALFCDLRGFTGFSESSDPEDVMTLLAEYHAAIGQIINKYSGTLERYAGDGVMVIFNDPVPVENPALKAVFMALDMRTAMEALTEKWCLLGHDIGFGIGIAHGFATLGTIGFEGRRDYAAIGTVSNVASRLCDEAKPGQILISPRVLLAIDKAVTVEQVGEFALKGIRRPMMAYNVLESSPSKSN